MCWLYVYVCTYCYVAVFRTNTNAHRSATGGPALTMMHIIIGTHKRIFDFPLDDPAAMFARTFTIPVWTDPRDYVLFCLTVPQPKKNKTACVA